MEKKILIGILLILLASIPFIVSIPQFLMFQGNVKIDERIAPEGAIINFSISGKELANSTVNGDGKYGPILIQGFSQYYGKPINITIINGADKYEAEQKIYYNSPQDINLNLSTITQKALKISASFPVGNTIKIQKTGEQIFSINTTNGYTDKVNYSVFVNGNLISNTSQYNYIIGNSDKGTHNITIIAGDGFLTVSKKWILIIERPEIGGFDGATTDFSSFGLNELGNVQNVVLEKIGKGKIEFLENLNLSGVTDLTNKVKIDKGLVAIDSSFYPYLNKKAKITLYGLTYNSMPKIYYTNGFTTTSSAITQECPSTQCTMINYTDFSTTNGEVTFNVSGFSSFLIKGSGMVYDLNKLDIDNCKKGIQGNLILDIKSPNKDESFKPGEEIKIEVEVNNENDADKKVLVKGILFNIDKDDEEEKGESDSQKIEARDSEDFEFSIVVPSDFDEEDSYFLFVKAYQKGNEGTQCNYEIVDLYLEREEHKIVVEEIVTNPQIAYPNERINMDIKVKNIGSSKEEGVYIKITNSKLGISEKSEDFDLEEYGEDDEATISKDFLIPHGTVDGEYPFKVEVFFGGKSNYTTETISVMNSSYIKLSPENTIYLSSVNIESSKTTIPIAPTIIPKAPLTGKAIHSKDSKEKTIDSIVKVSLTSEEEQSSAEAKSIKGAKNKSLYVPIGLIAGIIILIFLIILVNFRKNRLAKEK